MVAVRPPVVLLPLGSVPAPGYARRVGDDRGLRRPPRPPLGPLLRERLDLVLLVALGGAAGSLARWAVGVSLPQAAGSFSWPLLVVNASGSALLGALVVLLATRRPGSRRLRPLLGTGVLGGWTTFSAAALDLQGHLAGQRYDVAAVTAGRRAGAAACWPRGRCGAGGRCRRGASSLGREPA